LRSAVAKQHGLDEALVGELADYRTSAVLTDAQKSAIELADALMTQPGRLGSELRGRLQRHFTRSQIIELTLDVMKWNYQKVPVALGTDPEVVAGELTELVFDRDGHWMHPG
jgi:hypothetical protein